MTAVFYRDAEYGALAVLPGGPRQVVVVDHDFNAADYAAVLRLFEEMGGTPGPSSDGGEVWEFDSRVEVVSADLRNAMLVRGYDPDPLAARSERVVDDAVARAPDLPTAVAARPMEAVERVLIGHAQQAIASAAPGARSQVAFFERRTCDEWGDPLPFVRVRAVVKAADPGLCRRLRAVLSPISGCLERATVESVGGGAGVEFAFAPPAEAIRAIRTSIVPTFSPIDPVGSRTVRVFLNALMSEEAGARIAGRAEAGAAAVALAVPSPRVVVAKVPAGYAGDSLMDHAFQERLAWLMDALEPWDPTLDGISPVVLLVADA